jgi:ketosteroid isomerase-like protein
MRHSSLLLLVCVLMGVAPVMAQKKQRAARPPQTNAEQQQQLEDDKVGIQSLHDKDIRASLALDVPTLESLWTDDIVTMAPGAKAVVGRQDNAAKLEAGTANLKNMEIIAFDEQWQEIRIEGEWAYEWGTMSGRMRPFSGGAEIDYLMNVMRVLNRQPDGMWKIARSIYNDATAPAKPVEPSKVEEKKKDPLKD